MIVVSRYQFPNPAVPSALGYLHDLSQHCVTASLRHCVTASPRCDVVGCGGCGVWASVLWGGVVVVACGSVVARAVVELTD